MPRSAVARPGRLRRLVRPAALPLGTPIAEARQPSAGPSGQYPLPGGGTRLEFAMGSFGRQTYMLDFDAGGRLVAKQQVLTPQTFATIKPGMAQDEVLVAHRPAGVRVSDRLAATAGLELPLRRPGGRLRLFQVSISNATGTRRPTPGQNNDPACDPDRTDATRAC